MTRKIIVLALAFVQIASTSVNAISHQSLQQQILASSQKEHLESKSLLQTETQTQAKSLNPFSSIGNFFKSWTQSSPGESGSESLLSATYIDCHLFNKHCNEMCTENDIDCIAKCASDAAEGYYKHGLLNVRAEIVPFCAKVCDSYSTDDNCDFVCQKAFTDHFYPNRKEYKEICGNADSRFPYLTPEPKTLAYDTEKLVYPTMDLAEQITYNPSCSNLVEYCDHGCDKKFGPLTLKRVSCKSGCAHSAAWAYYFYSLKPLWEALDKHCGKENLECRQVYTDHIYGSYDECSELTFKQLPEPNAQNYCAIYCYNYYGDLTEADENYGKICDASCGVSFEKNHRKGNETSCTKAFGDPVRHVGTDDARVTGCWTGCAREMPM